MIELPLFGLSHRANSSHILKVGYIVNLACSTKQCNACSLQTVPHVVKCSMHWNRFSEFGWRTGPPPPPAHQNKERERERKFTVKILFCTGDDCRQTFGPERQTANYV